MNKQSVEIHVEPKDMPAYADLPEAARDAMADALLVLIQRGRLVLAGQVQDKLDEATQSKGAEGRR